MYALATARDFAARPYGRILKLGARHRVAQEDTVGRREPPPRKLREVHVRFESSHLAEDCLAEAYERLVPILRRQLTPAPTLQPVDTPHLNRATIRRRQS